MEKDELFGLLADIERRRAEIRLRMQELAEMQFWVFAMLALSVALLGGSMIWLTACALIARVS